jgi:hypothetical protein
MARKRTKGKAAISTMFNVAYEDGTMTSNRRVANELLDQSFAIRYLLVLCAPHSRCPLIQGKSI